MTPYIEAKKEYARKRFDEVFARFEIDPELAHDFLNDFADTLLDEIESRVVPEEPVFPSGKEHRDCERGYFCRECMPLVAQGIARDKTVKAFQHLRTGVETEV